MDQVVNLVNGAKPGDTLDITFRRGSVTKTVTVTLSDRPSSGLQPLRALAPRDPKAGGHLSPA